MSTSDKTQTIYDKRLVALTLEQAQSWSMNTENDLAWRIASGLAGWMQFCCAKLIGHHIREDPARMALVEILQAQRGHLWLHINKLPMGWHRGDCNERVDVCLGAEKTPGSAGVIELKWPWTVEEANRIQARVEMVQDIARLASIQTTDAPHVRCFVLGLMGQAVEPLLGKKHAQSADRERQRLAFVNLLSIDPRERTRIVALDELEAIFPDLQNRTPAACRLKGCAIRTRLMAAQELLVGNGGLGWVYVWQCDTVELPAVQVQPTGGA